MLKIQDSVDDIFCKLCAKKTDKPFREFDDESIRDKISIIKILAHHEKKNGLLGAVKYAISEVRGGKTNALLMQSALGVFLTHSKEAQKFGVVVPPLALYTQFKSKKRVYPSPSTPDTLKGPRVLSYFREDYDLNQHHLHWHNVYPASGKQTYSASGELDDDSLSRTINRQGELFLYMHCQMLARYNAELLSWNMEMVYPFDFDEIPLHRYKPPAGLTGPDSDIEYSTRPAGQGWYEGKNPHNSSETIPSKTTMVTWQSNIMKAILNECFITNDGGTHKITEGEAINTIGMMVEALAEAIQDNPEGVFPCRSKYGNIHNQGHNKFSEIGLSEAGNDFGVMGDVAAAIRDYVFWLWHRHVDNFRREIVRKYQHKIDAYLPEVKLCDVQIVPKEENSKTPSGGVATYLGSPNVDLHEVDAKLGHEGYRWEISVQSLRSEDPSESNPQEFTVRLFIVPEVLLQDHHAWIEMDKFTYSLTQKRATIIRLDEDSSVAVQVTKYSSNSRCSCGWPQSMMLPLGKPTGMDYVAFAILTNDQLGEVRKTNFSNTVVFEKSTIRVSVKQHALNYSLCYSVSFRTIAPNPCLSVEPKMASILIPGGWAIPLTRHGKRGLTVQTPWRPSSKITITPCSGDSRYTVWKHLRMATKRTRLSLLTKVGCLF